MKHKVEKWKWKMNNSIYSVLTNSNNLKAFNWSDYRDYRDAS